MGNGIVAGGSYSEEGGGASGCTGANAHISRGKGEAEAHGVLGRDIHSKEK